MKKNSGLTLIELLIALVMSAIIIAALYQTFIGQQKTYTVQEQVVDMQQNLRAGLNKMVREIRMAGFGNVSNILPPQNSPFIAYGGPFYNIINPINKANNIKQNDDQITIIGAFEQVSTLKTVGTNTIELEGNASAFSSDLNAKNKYICIGGLETHIVTGVNGNTITLSSNLKNNYNIGDPVFKVKAITYQLRWDNDNPKMPVLTREDNTDGGGKSFPLAENIENLQFMYTLVDGTETDSPANPLDIRMVKVIVTARTNIVDPELKDGGGYRKRWIASNILIRNMGLSP
jgi:prepilin-type N-terminal cleavage/methylation domain-containing protein